MFCVDQHLVLEKKFLFRSFYFYFYFFTERRTCLFTAAVLEPLHRVPLVPFRLASPLPSSFSLFLLSSFICSLLVLVPSTSLYSISFHLLVWRELLPPLRPTPLPLFRLSFSFLPSPPRLVGVTGRKPGARWPSKGSAERNISPLSPKSSNIRAIPDALPDPLHANDTRRAIKLSIVRNGGSAR